MASVDRRKLVFTDETGFHLAFTRAFGRAPRGERVVGRVPFKREPNQSLIGSLGLSCANAVDTRSRGTRTASRILFI